VRQPLGWHDVGLADPSAADEATALSPPHHSQDTPASLLEKLRRPDAPAAWERFVRLYTPFLYQCLRPLGLQEADKADLLQEVFLPPHRKLPAFSYDRTRSQDRKLRVVLLNKWRDLRRRRGLVPAGTPDEVLDAREAPDAVALLAEDEYRHALAH